MPVNHYMLGDSRDVDPRIRKLFAWGHFDNPQHPDAQNITADDLPLLSMKDEVVVEAVRSYQEYFIGALSEITQQMHGRDAQPDGDAGPATSKLLDMPRCGAPDYGNRQDARWPDSCKDELTVSYRFNTIDANLAKQCWQASIAAWNAVIDFHVRLQEQFSQNTHVWATDGPLPGSTLAWSMLSQGTCNQNAEQRYDTLVNWSVKLLTGTKGHEMGHAWGLNHLNSQSALMYPSIVGHIAPQELDIAAMVQLGYSRRTTPVPPPPGPTPGGAWTGELKSSEGARIALVGVPL